MQLYTSFDTAHLISRPFGGMIIRDMLHLDPRTRCLTTFDDQSPETSPAKRDRLRCRFSSSGARSERQRYKRYRAATPVPAHKCSFNSCAIRGTQVEYLWLSTVDLGNTLRDTLRKHCGYGALGASRGTTSARSMMISGNYVKRPQDLREEGSGVVVDLTASSYRELGDNELLSMHVT